MSEPPPEEEEDDDWFDPVRLEQTIRATSEERRKHPIEFLFSYLHDLSVDSTEAEFRRAWQRQVETQPWNARDALYALQVVNRNPPPALSERLRREAGLYLDHPGTARPYTDTEAQEWLKQLERDFQAVYTAYSTHDPEGSST